MNINSEETNTYKYWTCILVLCENFIIPLKKILLDFQLWNEDY
jgi:hypothetical protein